MLREPGKKYRAFPPIDLPNRQWPSRQIKQPPRWLSTDLRDGNQSLVDPMDGQQKLKYFRMLVGLGYKEIEVSFPSSGATDFDFTQSLITGNEIPDDVFIQVLSPCREDLVRQTFSSIKGAKNVIIHLYLAVSECFRRVVFGLSRQETLDLAVKCTKLARELCKSYPETNFIYEFSPEVFSDTPTSYAIEVCEAVKAAWEPTEEKKIIFNLPATVEMATPNVYADQIEYFSTRISQRERICISVHPHNDRGTAVAATELAQMAGADRVEGCLFGNGERTGNVDLVTLALNLYTQGIHPHIDFSNLESVIDVVEECNKIPVHPRAPYGGALVVCAFSGSHQDAIKKGFAARKAAGHGSEDPWQLPYLPLDPQDIGRNYEAVIRVNSQSGKGGAAWVVLQQLSLDLPRNLQIAFSKIVQAESEHRSRELLPSEIRTLFTSEYGLEGAARRFDLVDYSVSTIKSTQRRFAGCITVDGVEKEVSGTGNGALSSLCASLKPYVEIEISDYKEHAIGEGSDVQAATFVEMKGGHWGVGIHHDVVQSGLLAVLGVAGRLYGAEETTQRVQVNGDVNNGVA